MIKIMSKVSYKLNSWMFCPSDKAKLIEKSLEVSPSVVIYDLEDGIEYGKEDIALENLKSYWNQIKEKDFKKALRVSKESYESSLFFLFKNELDFDFIIFPKFEDKPELWTLKDILAKYNSKAKLVLMLESKKAIKDLNNLIALLKPEDKFFGFMVGKADLASDYNVEIYSELIESISLKVIQKCLENDFNYIEAPTFELNSEFALIANLNYLKRNGVYCKAIITPKQIAEVNSTLEISSEQIMQAREIISLSKEGAARYNGKMVDEAMAKKARKLLEALGE